MRLEEGLHEVTLGPHECWQGSLLTSELLRVLERALQDEPRDRVDVDGSHFASQAHRFKWNSTASRERVENPRGTAVVGPTYLFAEEINASFVFRFAPPVQDSSDCLLDNLFLSTARALFLLQHLHDMATDPVDQFLAPSGVPGSGSNVAMSAAREAASGRRAGQMCRVDMCP